MSKRRKPLLKFSPILLMIFGTLGCVLFSPPSLVIPTPIPTAPPLEEALLSVPGEVVTDPISDIVPDIDPDIETLVNAVSQQQLTAYVQQLESFGTRNAFSVIDQPAYGIGAAREWIFGEFIRVGQSSNGRLDVRYEEFPLNYNGFTADQRNIIAELPGTSGSNDVIIVMAHYDTRPGDVTDGFSRAPGANDNGSGVALLLETARLLSARTWNTTIIFAALAAEEQGTYGSKNLVQRMLQQGRNVQAAINYDTVGGRIDIPRSIRLFAPNLNQSPSGEVARYYSYMASLYVPTFPITVIDALDRENRWGDQREFIYAGMPAVRLTESIEDPDLVNSSRDTWSVIDFNYLQSVTRLNVAIIANMAGAPARSAPPTIVNMANPGSFLLTWPVDPEAAGYAISFRPVESPSYPIFRFVNRNDAGKIVLTGYDATRTYAISIAPIGPTGRMSMFSPEVVVGPANEQQTN
ncbi:MAG: M20/M25/M40 family metallo-hydrolase [Ardenticatenaceae bacterium]|nr:M20/M25/M40 family metallo-hydrolase [Ardenticatenaceae bacterium]